MFVRQNQQQFRNSNADVQIFYGSGSTAANAVVYSWSKPSGVSHVYMMLIGAGGSGDTTTSSGGGSGAVTVWYGAAQNVPDNLVISPAIPKAPGSGGPLIDTTVNSRNKNGLNVLLTAASGNNAVGLPASAMTPNQFSATGIFQSVAGQTGVSGANQLASATTFLSGGAGNGFDVFANYGYKTDWTNNNKNGYFQFQPIIVGMGSTSDASLNMRSNYGCGGGGMSSGAGTYGGQGMVLIASW